VPTRSRDAPVAALEAGGAFPPGDFRFSVHSAYGRAANLAPEGGGRLLALVAADADCPPNGLRLESRRRFDAWPLRTGLAGRREGYLLSFDAEGSLRLPRIDLSRARRLAAAPLPPIDPRRPGLAAAWAEGAAALEAIQGRKGTELRLAELHGRAAPGALSGTAMGARLARAALELAASLSGDAAGEGGTVSGALSDKGAAGRRPAAAAATTALAAAARLVGLGPGLTPAGDDFLCGLLAALRCVGQRGRAAAFAEEFRAALPSLLASTNAISAASLGCAAEGLFPAALSRLAAALAGAAAPEPPAGGGPAAVPGSTARGMAAASPAAAVEALCAAGHSSGADMATGLLIGIDLVLRDERRRYAP